MLRAFQSWAVLGNINIGLVADAGAPAGQAGPPQGRPGQGDLRLSARPLDPNTGAETTPFDLLGTWSGNVVLNSQAVFGNGAGTYDLFGVVLHEAGHAFGLGENPADPSSAMYPVAVSGRTAPSAADAAAIRALYGSRKADAFEGILGNDQFWTATPLGVPGSGNAGVLEADLTTATDRDVFVVHSPVFSGASLSVVVHASGLSLLTPRVTVYDALGQTISQAVSTDPLHNDLVLTVPASLPGATFYVRVEAAQAGVFGIGSYRIAAGSPAQAAAAAAAAPVQSAAKSNGNTPADRVTTVPSLLPAADPRWSFTARATLDRAAGVDTYRFKTGKEAAPVLLASAWGVRPDGLAPRLEVTDACGNRLPTQALYQDAGMVTLQATGIAPNTWYAVRVAAASPAGSQATGGYVVGVDQRTSALPLESLVSDNLSAGHDQELHTLTVTSAVEFHFDLSVSGGGADGKTAAKVGLYDAEGRPIGSIRAVTGAGPATADVLLGPGVYFLRTIAATRNRTPLAPTVVCLRGLVRSEAIGPSLIDPTLGPATTLSSTAPKDPYDLNSAYPSHPSLLLGPVDVFIDPWQVGTPLAP